MLNVSAIVSVINLTMVTGKPLGLIDREPSLSEDNFEAFKQIYHPIWKEHFKDAFDLNEGSFTIDRNAQATRHLISHLNSGVRSALDTSSL